MIVTDDPASDRIKALGFIIPSPKHLAEVKDRCIRRPSDIPIALAEFGIADPTLSGWSSYLKGLWYWEGAAIHDTVFDAALRAKLISLPGLWRVPLVNVRNAP